MFNFFSYESHEANTHATLDTDEDYYEVRCIDGVHQCVAEFWID